MARACSSSVARAQRSLRENFPLIFGDRWEEAGAIYRAMESVLESGKVTADLKPAGKPATTSEVGDSICSFLSQYSKSEAVSTK